MAQVRSIPGVPPRGTAILDMAVGVVMAMTGTDPVTARTDLVATAHTARLDVFVLAHTVVGACCGHTSGEPRPALDAATGRWPQLLTDRTPAPTS